jgi:UDPglucose 6-dehydrogenase
MKGKNNLLIGFIGQGFIGKNYADDFEERGYKIVRYDNQNYSNNKDLIKTCDIVFIAVPTPSVNEKFQDNIIFEVLKLISDNKIAVIKSTIKIGTTDKMQKLYPNKYIIHSPEFLTEATAAYDARHPDRNIVGYTEKSKKIATSVLKIMAKAPMNLAVPCREAEIIKYANNIWFYMKVVTINTIADLCLKNNIDYEIVKKSMMGDSRVGNTHLDVFHKSGRGAGGHCFIKDFSCYKEMHEDSKTGKLILNLLTAAENYNKKLLQDSNKNLDILSGVYNVKKGVNKKKSIVKK